MRNPFSVDDVPDPEGADVEEFARTAQITPDPSADENALAWVTVATEGDGLAGPWTCRWRTPGGPWVRGVATLHVDGTPRESLRPAIEIDLAAPVGGPGDPILYQALKLFERK